MRLETVARAVCVPAFGPSVRRVLAMPLASLVRVVGDTLPPPAVTDQVTATPGSAAPALSRTITANDSGNAAPAAAT